MTTEYSGTSMRDLNALVDNTLAIHGIAECKRVAEANPPAKQLQPWEEIAVIRNALATIMFDVNGQPARHYRVFVKHYHELAKLQDELMAAVLEPEDIPTHCQARIAQNCEDVNPHECGKKVEPGSEFCKEHQGQ